MIGGTLPLRTERSARTIGIGTNALASSIVLVCRCRPADAPTVTRAAFLRDLKRELPEALRLLQAGNIAPVDLAQAAIGPGMAVFTRHAAVLEADDTPMSVRTALQLINAALDEHLSEQDADLDPATRFAVTWFDQNGMTASDFGAANTLATARGISVQGVHRAGIVVSGGGKVRLTRRDELPDAWEPGHDTPVWQASQHLIRRLLGEGGSEERAAGLLARLNGQGEAARDLAYRLYGICERRKWAEEAYAYNALVASWPRLRDLARRLPQGPDQAEMEV